MLARLLPANEGRVDRTLRVLLGLALIALAIFRPGTTWAWIGVVPVITGLLGSCPVYTLLGMNTCPTRR